MESERFTFAKMHHVGFEPANFNEQARSVATWANIDLIVYHLQGKVDFRRLRRASENARVRNRAHTE